MKRETDSTVTSHAIREFYSRKGNPACDNEFKLIVTSSDPLIDGTIKVVSSCKSKKVRSSGFLPIRPFSVSTTSYKSGSGVITHDEFSVLYGCKIGYLVGELGFGAVRIPVKMPEYEAALQGCVNAACAQAQSDAFNAFTTLAEGAKSLKTISDVTSTLFARSHVLLEKTAKANRKFYRSKQSHNEAYFSLMQDFNNVWLLGRYGIRPMVHDVLNFVDTYRYPPKVRKKGSASRSFDINGNLDEVLVDNGIERRVRSTVASGSVTVRGSAWAEIPSNRDSKLIHRGSAVETAWDLVPISFLIDKIVDVKSFLINTTTFGADLRATCGSVKTELTYDTDLQIRYSGTANGVRHVGDYQGNASVSFKSYERIPMGRSSVPPLDLRFDTLTWVDFASIVTSKYRLFEKAGHQIIKRL